MNPSTWRRTQPVLLFIVEVMACTIRTFGAIGVDIGEPGTRSGVERNTPRAEIDARSTGRSPTDASRSADGRRLDPKRKVLSSSLFAV
jgi:hypothetical protein